MLEDGDQFQPEGVIIIDYEDTIKRHIPTEHVERFTSESTSSSTTYDSQSQSLNANGDQTKRSNMNKNESQKEHAIGQLQNSLKNENEERQT